MSDVFLYRAKRLVKDFERDLFSELSMQVNHGNITRRTAYKFLEDNVQFEYDWEDFADEEGI